MKKTAKAILIALLLSVAGSSIVSAESLESPAEPDETHIFAPSSAILGTFQESGIWDLLPPGQRQELSEIVAVLDDAEATLRSQMQIPFPKLFAASVETCNGEGTCGGTYKTNNTYGHYAYNKGDYWGCSNNTLSPILGFAVDGDVTTCTQIKSNKIEGDVEESKCSISFDIDNLSDVCTPTRVGYVIMVQCTFFDTRPCQEFYH
jgi:hypothetical protein